MEQINEELARRAKDANSFSEYVEGSATAGYNASCALKNILKKLKDGGQE